MRGAAVEGQQHEPSPVTGVEQLEGVGVVADVSCVWAEVEGDAGGLVAVAADGCLLGAAHDVAAYPGRSERLGLEVAVVHAEGHQRTERPCDGGQDADAGAVLDCGGEHGGPVQLAEVAAAGERHLLGHPAVPVGPVLGPDAARAVASLQVGDEVFHRHECRLV